MNPADEIKQFAQVKNMGLYNLDHHTAAAIAASQQAVNWPLKAAQMTDQRTPSQILLSHAEAATQEAIRLEAQARITENEVLKLREQAVAARKRAEQFTVAANLQSHFVDESNGNNP